MKKRTLGVLSAAAAAVAGVVLIATSANAAAPPAPPTPTRPYPTVTINKVCPIEGGTVAKAQAIYDGALAAYNLELKAYNVGSGALADLLNLQITLDNATIALNDAGYAQATCQKKAINPPPADVNCVTLALAFNRFTDDLAATQDIEASTLTLYNMAVANFRAGVGSQAAVDVAKATYAAAQAQTVIVQAQIAAALTAATAAKCPDIKRPAPGGGGGPAGPGGGGGPSGSPAPSSPAPNSPAPSGPAPSSPAPAPSDTPS